MPYSSIADDRFAFNDLCDDVNFVVSEEYPDAFAYGCGVAADGDQLPVAGHTHRDIARKPQDAFSA